VVGLCVEAECGEERRLFHADGVIAGGAGSQRVFRVSCFDCVWGNGIPCYGGRFSSQVRRLIKDL
jgi:hypothetical protein